MTNKSDLSGDKSLFTPQAKLQRGPNYPFVDLAKGLAYTEKLYGTYKMFPIPELTAFKLMGYSEKASGARRVAATLLDFGLIESVKGLSAREFKITDRARRIILKAPEASDLLKEAALLPPAFKSIWNHFNGELPPDDSIRNYLIFKAGYSEEIAPKVIKLFKNTIDFSGVTSSSPSSESEDPNDSETLNEHEDSGESRSELNMGGKSAELKRNSPSSFPERSNRSDILEMRFPLSKGREAILFVAKDMSKKDFDLLVKYLELARDAVSDETE